MKRFFFCLLVLGATAALAVQQTPQIKDGQPFWYIVIQFQGSHLLIPEKVGVVLEEMRRQQLQSKIQSGLFLIDFDSPLLSGAKTSGWGLGFKIAPDAEAHSPFLRKKYEYPKVGTIIYKGPFETTNNAYNVLVPFIEENGFEIVGPPVEIWNGDPDRDKPEDLTTEIIIPVREGKK